MPSFWKAAPSALSTEEKRNATENEYRRNSKLARIRDGHHCRICGSTFGLETHHLVPRSRAGKALRNAVSNLVTLCRHDHVLVTRNITKLVAVKPEDGANGRLRVCKYDVAEKGYVTITEAA